MGFRLLFARPAIWFAPTSLLFAPLAVGAQANVHHLYQTLEAVGKQHKVSIAWVLRDAVEKYVTDKWPPFAGTAGTSCE